MKLTRLQAAQRRRARRRHRDPIKLPRKLKKRLKKEEGSTNPKHVRIVDYRWKWEPDEFGGDYVREPDFDYPKMYPKPGPRFQRLNERQAEWNIYQRQLAVAEAEFNPDEHDTSFSMSDHAAEHWVGKGITSLLK